MEISVQFLRRFPSLAAKGEDVLQGVVDKLKLELIETTTDLDAVDRESLLSIGSLPLLVVDALKPRQQQQQQDDDGERRAKKPKRGKDIVASDLLTPGEIKPPKTLQPPFVCPLNWLEDVKAEVIAGLRRRTDSEDVMTDRDDDTLDRVPPMGVVRCSCGGKTRALYEIANMMKGYEITTSAVE